MEHEFTPVDGDKLPFPKDLLRYVPSEDIGLPELDEERFQQEGRRTKVFWAVSSFTKSISRDKD